MPIRKPRQKKFVGVSVRKRPTLAALRRRRRPGLRPVNYNSNNSSWSNRSLSPMGSLSPRRSNSRAQSFQAALNAYLLNNPNIRRNFMSGGTTLRRRSPSPSRRR